ncbi:MAG: MlaD family protein [Brevinemataceae bacterium]
MAEVKRDNPNLIIIGAFMLIGLIAIILSVVVSNKLVARLKGGYSLYVTFNELDGLTLGSKIMVGSGKAIGQVSSINLEGSLLIVELFIEKRYKINRNARFKIFSTSLVGGKYLAVENYTGQAPFFDPDERVIGYDPMSINRIFSTITDLFSSETDNQLGQSVSGILSSFSDAASDAKQIIRENHNNINIIVSNLVKTSVHLNSITAQLDRKLSTVSDVEFESMITNLQASLLNLQIFLSDINSPSAPLSVLKDPEVNNSLRTIVTNLEETTKRVKAKPSLLFKS